jgi:hypothetical protein
MIYAPHYLPRRGHHFAQAKSMHEKEMSGRDFKTDGRAENEATDEKRLQDAA